MSERQLSLSLISDITARINSTDDLDELLGIIIETTKDVLNTEGCSLLLYDQNEDCLVFNVAKGTKGDSLTELKVPRGKGIAGMVLETLEPVIVNDAANDPRIYRNIDETVGFVTNNLICVPMSTQGESKEFWKPSILSKEMNSRKEILRFFNIFLILPQSRSEIED
ncbi:GAF domain protein [Leptospira interrogans str. UI 09600]|nr:GAF domain protein [Leptospira interrogans str. UI 09600]